MPDIAAEHMFGWLVSAGPAMSGAMGPVPLSASELAAWASGHAITLAPWEFAALQAASRAYCRECMSPSPWPPFGDPDALYDDDVVAENLSRNLDKLC